ncbi:MAG: YeeE/YedE family protein [Rhodospirillaceae bacterium]|jgi:uncharacterized protein|nr:YeeE/YedE family protein [Rhodospirillaceae bacterium]MBT4671547.1 YeeE/YedE family protein [Rhodospirillaceae bacterium]
MEDIPIGILVSGLGLLLGMVFGATAQRTNFCTMGAISDIVFMGDWNRFRSWLLAMAVAIPVSQYMHLTGTVDLGKSIYLTTNLGWAGAIIGGLIFGFGMTLSGGCGNKTLVRIGTGNMKSLVTAIFLGLFAYMTLRGLIGLARVEFEAAVNTDLKQMGLASQGMADMLAAITGLGLDTARQALTVFFTAGLLYFCFKSPDFRNSKINIIAGLIVGLLIPAAWYTTGVIGQDDFDPVQLTSFTFIAPTGDSLQYLMTFSGATVNFGIATVGGVIAGSFLMGLVRGQIHYEGFNDPGDFRRNISGGSLMGIGGVLALGCTVGQGLTGLSTLALGSLIALIAIIAGAVYGMKYLEEGSLGGAFRALLAR